MAGVLCCHKRAVGLFDNYCGGGVERRRGRTEKIAQGGRIGFQYNKKINKTSLKKGR